jgi:hypothetical protein
MDCNEKMAKTVSCTKESKSRTKDNPYHRRRDTNSEDQRRHEEVKISE